MKKERLKIFLKAFRVNQWIKNFVVFTAIVFSGQLFNLAAFWQSVYAFLIFCLLSSTSYILNDIIDYPYDRKHPIKKNRPIASGKITLQEATFTVFVMTLVTLVISIFLSLKFFFLALIFILLHFFYSLYLKKHPVVDIFAISFSFVLRAFAGEVATGFHIPIYLLLTIFFVALFMATVKRHAELLIHGRGTRSSLSYYKEHLLDFLSNTFATTTIIAYSSYTYFFEKVPATNNFFTDFKKNLFPNFEARRWFMVTIPFVVYGISRYAQLLYERDEGEAPEKIIVHDKPLVGTIVAWAIVAIVLIYVL